MPLSRPPKTLWTHTLAELWRVLALTTTILVTVIAFSMAVQLMAAGKIGPGDMPRLMLLATVPMLQYALPFAAGFSATLTYHRMAQDLEVTACAAGGVSHRAILAPALLSGVLLAGGLVALNEQVIPRFLRGIERMITDDAMKMMVQSFERGEAVVHDDLMIAADRIFEAPERPVGVDQYVILERVIAVELNGDGGVKSEAQAELAHVWYYRDRPVEGEGAIVIRMEGVVGNTDDGSYVEMSDLPLARRIPDAFSDDPKFLTFGELRRLRHEPARMNFVEQRRRALALHLGARRSLEGMIESLRSIGATTLEDADGRRVRVRASDLRYDAAIDAWAFQPRSGEPVTLAWALEEGQRGSAPSFDAGAALLRIDLAGERAAQPFIFELEIRDYTVRTPGVDDRASGTLASRKWGVLRAEPDPMPELLAMPTDTLLDTARPRVEGVTPDGFLLGPYRDLTKRLDRLSREITSKQHERMAMAAACLVMVLTGAVMALRLSGALPLTVYLWSFFPALATVITIASGQQIVHKQGAIGLVLLWGGVLGLAAYTIAQYGRLRRH